MNGLNPNMINASELWYAIISHVCDFNNHVLYDYHLKTVKDHQNVDLFETIPSLIIIKITHIRYKCNSSVDI